MNLRLAFTVLAAVMLNATSGVAQSYPDYFIPQHLRPADPQMAAMGLTGVAHRTGVLAAYSNPAGLAKLDELKITYSRYPSRQYIISSIRNMYAFGQHSFAFAVPVMKNFAIGTQYWDLDFGESQTTDVNGVVTQTRDVGIRQYQFTPAVCFDAGKNNSFFVGINVKHLKYYGFTEIQGWLFDFGLRANSTVGKYQLSFGASIQNMGSELDISFENYGISVDRFTDQIDAYRWMKIGLAFGNSEIKSPSKSPIKFLASVEYQKNLEYKIGENWFDGVEWESLNGGLELRFLDHLFGQIGFVKDISGNIEIRRRQGMTYGFGFETPEHIHIGLPLSIAMAYGRSIHYGIFDMDVFSIILGCQL